MDDLAVIENPLEWQVKMDNAPASINMRGCARFWFTVAAKLGRQVWIDGSPNITEVAIDLGDGVALLLKSDASYDDLDADPELTTEDRLWQEIEYRFVAIEDLGNMMSAVDWHNEVIGHLKAVLPPDWKITPPMS